MKLTVWVKIAAGHEVKHKAAMSKAGEGVVSLYRFVTGAIWGSVICVVGLIAVCQNVVAYVVTHRVCCFACVHATYPINSLSAALRIWRNVQPAALRN